MKYCFMIAITYRDSAEEGTRRGWVLRLGTGLKFLCDSAEPVIDAIDAFSVDRYGCMERRGGSPARFSPAALHPQPGTGLRACPVYGEEHRHDGVFYGGGGGLPGGRTPGAARGRRHDGAGTGRKQPARWRERALPDRVGGGPGGRGGAGR